MNELKISAKDRASLIERWPLIRPALIEILEGMEDLTRDSVDMPSDLAELGKDVVVSQIRRVGIDKDIQAYLQLKREGYIK